MSSTRLRPRTCAPRPLPPGHTACIDAAARRLELGLGRAGGRVLDVAVAVRGDRYLLQGLEAPLRVEATLELAQHEAEQGVTPGGLGEGAAVARQRAVDH